MLNWIIAFSLRNRTAVLAAVAVVVFAGAWSLRYLDIDAFPDTTPVMVQINCSAPSLSPEEVERQITFPIEQSISGLPALKVVARSRSSDCPKSSSCLKMALTSISPANSLPNG